MCPGLLSFVRSFVRRVCSAAGTVVPGKLSVFPRLAGLRLRKLGLSRCRHFRDFTGLQAKEVVLLFIVCRVVFFFHFEGKVLYATCVYGK